MTLTDPEVQGRMAALIQQRDSLLDQVVMQAGRIAQLEADMRANVERTSTLLKQLNRADDQATHVEGAWVASQSSEHAPV